MTRGLGVEFQWSRGQNKLAKHQPPRPIRDLGLSKAADIEMCHGQAGARWANETNGIGVRAGYGPSTELCTQCLAAG
jgi:hypothetical protein